MLLKLNSVEFAWKGHPVFLQIPEYKIEAGEQVFLKGPSGSGKSTLLGLIAGVLTARSGEILFDGGDFRKMSNGRRDQIRARDMGVIFQLFNLLPYLDLVSNVALPCRLSPERRARVMEVAESPEAEARRLLTQLGLGDEAAQKKPVSDLSVGQQQRVAAARALIGRPKLVIADEPTSALDHNARDGFLELLQGECEAAGSALLFVSHDAELAERFQRVDNLSDLNTLAREPV